ncbi:MAG: DNA methyltransferase [Patescibacteria group bacterium]|nr:DNA methyltransferase [Patescibacteria group bacterium]
MNENNLQIEQQETTDNTFVKVEPLVMLPYYDQDGITIYNADCRIAMRALRPSWIITDPPYGINYNAERQNLNSGQKYKDIENDDGNLNLEFIFSAEGNKVVFGANCFPNLLPHRGRWICWDKRTNEQADKALGSPFELAWTSLTSGYDRIYRVMHGGFVNDDGGKRFHPTQKPVRLFYRILEDFTKQDDLILDPFMGSGTTCEVAKKLGRNFIGIDISKRYCNLAEDRLNILI